MFDIQQSNNNNNKQQSYNKQHQQQQLQQHSIVKTIGTMFRRTSNNHAAKPQSQQRARCISMWCVTHDQGRVKSVETTTTQQHQLQWDINNNILGVNLRPR